MTVTKAPFHEMEGHVVLCIIFYKIIKKQIRSLTSIASLSLHLHKNLNIYLYENHKRYLPIVIVFVTVKNSFAACPCSRAPVLEFFMPPKGA